MWFDSAIHAREWLSPSTNMLMLNRVSLCTAMYSLVTCYLKSKHLLPFDFTEQHRVKNVYF